MRKSSLHKFSEDNKHTGTIGKYKLSGASSKAESAHSGGRASMPGLKKKDLEPNQNRLR